MILDATAGSRQMWPNKNPPHVVFMDKNIHAFIPPHIFASNEYCPFRDHVFGCVLFDPPHAGKGKTSIKLKWADPTNRNYLGLDTTKQKILINIYKAQKEFQRLTNRLCFKWSWNPKMGKSRGTPLENVLPFFKDWKVIHKKEWKNRTATASYWITFVRSSR